MAARSPALPGYSRLVSHIAEVVAVGRRQAAWSLNAVMSAVYWDIGRQIVEFEQKGRATAEYGERVISLLAEDLHARFGRGFRKSNLYQFRRFFLAYQDIFQTVSGKSSSGPLKARASVFTLPWSHYARLLPLKNEAARKFYEAEALRGGWSFRQRDRQISAQLYERLALSRKKAVVLTKAEKSHRQAASIAEEELRDPYILEFLDLKDEYSESDLEEALIRHLEQFLTELGSGFCFCRSSAAIAHRRRMVSSISFSFTASCGAW